MEPNRRDVARIIIMDPAHRILLLRYSLPEASILWAAPGGGVEPGESHEDAAHRELREELGLENCELGPCIWVREFIFYFRGQQFRQRERFYLCRTAPFEPPSEKRPELVQEGVLEVRWWTQDALRAASEMTFAPRQLRELLAQLIAEGPPRDPINTGL